MTAEIGELVDDPDNACTEPDGLTSWTLKVVPLANEPPVTTNGNETDDPAQAVVLTLLVVMAGLLAAIVNVGLWLPITFCVSPVVTTCTLYAPLLTDAGMVARIVRVPPKLDPFCSRPLYWSAGESRVVT